MATARPDKVTIYEVAARAGVSIATVSHAINRPTKVSERTRARVLEAVDELQFVPKPTAVSLAKRGVGRIGVMAPFTSYSSYMERLAGVLQANADHGYDVVVFDTDSAAASTSPLLSTLPITGRLDGLIIMGLPLGEVADSISQRKLPTVLVDSTHPDFSSVNVDDEAGGYLLGQHLLAQGCRTFAFVTEDQRSADYLSGGQRRIRGVMKALTEAGLGDDAIVGWVVTTSDIQGGRAAVPNLLALDPVPDAVLALHDDLAAGVQLELRTRGIDVPAQIAVVGYDGHPLAEALDITTVVQPFSETGYQAATLLQQIVSGHEGSLQSINLGPSLLVRGSSDRSTVHPRVAGSSR